MPKRSLFLAGSAATLAGCGGGHGLSSIIPGAGGTSASSATPQRVKASDKTTAPALPIPQHVLANPIVGEVRRFDGSVAPQGWMLCQGQQLPVAQYPLLFTVRKKTGGGDGKTFVALPAATALGQIIAVNGTIPKNPVALAQLRTGAAMLFGVSIPGMAVQPARPRALTIPGAIVPIAR
jgi:Phage Tail Collar Domain